LGDVLLQVMLHSAIGKKEGYFDIREEVGVLRSKMVRRHPHVFGEEKADSLDDLHEMWQKEKQKEGKVKREKMEKIFADYFLKLYDKTKLDSLNEKELEALINIADLKL